MRLVTYYQINLLLAQHTLGDKYDFLGVLGRGKHVDNRAQSHIAEMPMIVQIGRQEDGPTDGPARLADFQANETRIVLGIEHRSVAALRTAI